MLNSCFCIVLLCHRVFLSQVIEKVEKLRSVLTQPSNLRVHVAADVNRLPANPHTLWKTQLLPNSLATIPTKYGLIYISWLYCTSIQWWKFFVSSVDLKNSTFSMESLVGIWAASLNEKIQAFLYVSYLLYCNNLKGILSSEHPYTLQAFLQPDQSFCACLTDPWVG